MKKFFSFLITIVLLLGCSAPSTQDLHSSNSYFQYIKNYSEVELDSIIQHSRYTIIFGWTQWCQASQNQLKEYLIPFLKKKPDDIGVISVCCANSEKLLDFLEKNDYKHSVYLLSGSWGGLDKQRLKGRFHALFGSSISVNYVPIVILCDAQKQILNWDTINKCYRGIGSTILQIENNQY